MSLVPFFLSNSGKKKNPLGHYAGAWGGDGDAGGSQEGLFGDGAGSISPSGLSPWWRCRPPYLSPPFQGQAKLFLLSNSCRGWAMLITTRNWPFISPHPSGRSVSRPRPGPSLPLVVPCGDGLGFWPSSGHTLTLGW